MCVPGDCDCFDLLNCGNVFAANFKNNVIAALMEPKMETKTENNETRVVSSKIDLQIYCKVVLRAASKGMTVSKYIQKLIEEDLKTVIKNDV